MRPELRTTDGGMSTSAAKEPAPERAVDRTAGSCGSLSHVPVWLGPLLQMWARRLPAAPDAATKTATRYVRGDRSGTCRSGTSAAAMTRVPARFFTKSSHHPSAGQE